MSEHDEKKVVKSERKLRNKPGTIGFDKLMIDRREYIKTSMKFDYVNHLYDGHFQRQPMGEEFAVCAVVVAAHITNKYLDNNSSNVNGRATFDEIAIQFEKETADKNGCYHTSNGHYHITVLEKFLRVEHGLKFCRVKLDGKKIAERRESLIAYINSIEAPTVLFFQATIILTASSLKLAPKHYVCVKVLSDGKGSVLLDGLFRSPMHFCIPVLMRYTQIDSLYIVSSTDTCN